MALCAGSLVRLRLRTQLSEALFPLGAKLSSSGESIYWANRLSLSLKTCSWLFIHLGSSWPQVPILHRSTSRQISWSYPSNGLLLNLLNNVALLVFGLTPARHHISMRLTSLSGLPEGCVSPPCGFEQIESCSLYHFSKASAGRPTWQWEFPTYQYFLEVIQQQGKINWNFRNFCAILLPQFTRGQKTGGQNIGILELVPGKHLKMS